MDLFTDPNAYEMKPMHSAPGSSPSLDTLGGATAAFDVDREEETIVSIPQARDMTRAKLHNTKYSLYSELRKTEGFWASVCKTFSLSGEAKTLAKRVTSNPTNEQKLQATLVTRAVAEAREKGDITEGFTHLKARLTEMSVEYPGVVTAGFDQAILKEGSKQLFLHFARKEALSAENLGSIKEMLDTLEIPLEEEDLVQAYTSDERCRSNTKRELIKIREQVRVLENGATSVRTRILEEIDVRAAQLAKFEKAYFATAAKVDELARKIETDFDNFTEADEAKFTELSAKKNRIFTRLAAEKEAYDEVTSYAKFLDAHVMAIEDSLEAIYDLKRTFLNYQAPFAHVAEKSSHPYAMATIMEIKTTPIISDTANPDRLPHLRTINDLLDSFKQAVEQGNRVLASRIFYELSEYRSPIKSKGYQSALDAICSELKMPDAGSFSSPQEVFINFFSDPSSEHKSLILNAISALKRS